jgi:hypothetical protein
VSPRASCSGPSSPGLHWQLSGVGHAHDTAGCTSAAFTTCLPHHAAAVQLQCNDLSRDTSHSPLYLLACRSWE